MPKEKPNILFLLIDSLNSKNCLENDKTSITPNIDSLIKNGVCFDQTISCASTTVPSICSMFTGTYPFNSIVVEETLYKLNTQIQNFIQILERDGYSDSGFIPDVIKHIDLEHIFHSKLETFDSFSTTYDILGEKIVNILERKKMKHPWFLYLHLYDLHGTATFYKNKPDNFQDAKFGKNQYDRMISALDVWIGKFLQHVDMDNTLIILTADHGSDVSTYNLELEKKHNYYIKIRDSAHQNNLAVKTGVKFSSKIPKILIPLKKKISTKIKDTKKNKEEEIIQSEFEKIRGENLSPYEKRRLENCIHVTTQCFDDRYRIPLIFSGKFIPSNLKIHKQVRNIDIFPTILELLDIPFTNPYIESKSLLPLIKGERADDLTAYMDSIGNTVGQRTDNVVGIRTSDFKYFRDRKKTEYNTHLFNLKIDPLEENNLSEKYSDITKKMEKMLLEINPNNDFYPDSVQNSTDKEEEERINEQLRKMGYT